MEDWTQHPEYQSAYDMAAKASELMTTREILTLRISVLRTAIAERTGTPAYVRAIAVSTAYGDALFRNADEEERQLTSRLA